MKIKRIIRTDKVTVIDEMEVWSHDYVLEMGLSSRGRVMKSHIEKTLVLFNKFKIKLPRYD